MKLAYPGIPRKWTLSDAPPEGGIPDRFTAKFTGLTFFLHTVYIKCCYFPGQG